MTPEQLSSLWVFIRWFIFGGVCIAIYIYLQQKLYKYTIKELESKAKKPNNSGWKALLYLAKIQRWRTAGPFKGSIVDFIIVFFIIMPLLLIFVIADTNPDAVKEVGQLKPYFQTFWENTFIRLAKFMNTW